MKDDRKLVRLVPSDDTNPVTALLLQKEFEAWEERNRTEINKEVERLINQL